jgi:hypothetical protein
MVGQILLDNPPVMHAKTLANSVGPRRVRVRVGFELNVKPDDGAVVLVRAPPPPPPPPPR